jgi:hypothetical protein
MVESGAYMSLSDMIEESLLGGWTVLEHGEVEDEDSKEFLCCGTQCETELFKEHILPNCRQYDENGCSSRGNMLSRCKQCEEWVCDTHSRRYAVSRTLDLDKLVPNTKGHYILCLKCAVEYDKELEQEKEQERKGEEEVVEIVRQSLKDIHLEYEEAFAFIKRTTPDAAMYIKLGLPVVDGDLQNLPSDEYLTPGEKFAPVSAIEVIEYYRSNKDKLDEGGSPVDFFLWLVRERGFGGEE